MGREGSKRLILSTRCLPLDGIEDARGNTGLRSDGLEAMPPAAIGRDPRANGGRRALVMRTTAR
jgi:hypothetical protein